MTGTTQEESEAKIEGESRELKNLLDQLSEHTVTGPVDVENGTLKIDTNQKIALFERVFNYDGSEELDHESIDLGVVELKDIVQVNNSENNDSYGIFMAHEERPYKKLVFWPDRRRLRTDDFTMEIALTKSESEKLENWIKDKLEG